MVRLPDDQGNLVVQQDARNPDREGDRSVIRYRPNMGRSIEERVRMVPLNECEDLIRAVAEIGGRFPDPWIEVRPDQNLRRAVVRDRSINTQLGEGSSDRHIFFARPPNRYWEAEPSRVAVNLELRQGEHRNALNNPCRTTSVVVGDEPDVV